MQTLLRKIGFEVEFSCPVNPLSEINRVLQRMAEPVTLAGYYRHSVGSAWDLKLDSSCGYEIASPIIDSYESLVKASKIVDIVKRAGGTVNPKCGLHVHVDMNGVDAEKFERVMRFMSRYEEAFFLLADASRQNNDYCRKLCGQDKLIKADPTQFRSAWREKRYWLNGTHLSGQGTLEFRLMASHLEAEYIVGWVLFLLHSTNYLLKGKHISWGKAKCASDRDLLQTMLAKLDSMALSTIVTSPPLWLLASGPSQPTLQKWASLTVEARPPPFNSLRPLLSDPLASLFPWMKPLDLLQPSLALPQCHPRMQDPLLESVVLVNHGPLHSKSRRPQKLGVQRRTQAFCISSPC